MTHLWCILMPFGAYNTVSEALTLKELFLSI